MPPDAEGKVKHKPFHHYSMKQAVQERFILDVLENFVPVDSYYKLIKKIEGTLARIRAGMDEHAVLVFHDQAFTDAEQIQQRRHHVDDDAVHQPAADRCLGTHVLCEAPQTQLLFQCVVVRSRQHLCQQINILRGPNGRLSRVTN